MSRPWMPLWISDYLGDTQHLGALEHGAYLLLIMQYWQKECLPDDETQLMRIARLTPDEWSNARATLQALFKPGWKHPRIDAELQQSDEKFEKRAKAGKAGGKASALARRLAKEAANQALVQQPSTNASSNRAAKSNHPHPHPHIVSVPSERAPVAPPDEDAELFRVGKKLLGPNAGGQIAKLKAAKGGSVPLARAALETASTKENAAEYIAAVTRGGTGPPNFAGRQRPNGGFTELLIQQHAERSNGSVTIDHDDHELSSGRP